MTMILLANLSREVHVERSALREHCIMVRLRQYVNLTAML